MTDYFLNKIKNFIRDEDATAAIEAALLFPTLIMMLVSMIDIGNGLLANQKLIASTQATADLITRLANPSLQERDDAILAGQLALSPFMNETYAYYVGSYKFDSNNDPEVIWEESSNLNLDQNLISNVSDLGSPGEGFVIVNVQYTYRPFFTGFVIGDIAMSETAYMRGRKAAVVGLPVAS
jgi:Flp pilus assembly protein TadG